MIYLDLKVIGVGVIGVLNQGTLCRSAHHGHLSFPSLVSNPNSNRSESPGVWKAIQHLPPNKSSNSQQGGAVVAFPIYFLYIEVGGSTLKESSETHYGSRG